LAHKAEHAVDWSSGAPLAMTLQGADQGDTTTIHQTLAEAGEAVAELMIFITHRKTAVGVSTANNRRVREMLE
jgi:hypothetical protein